LTRNLDFSDDYRDLFEHSLDCICLHTLDGRLISVNPAFVRSAGARSAQDLVGTSIRALLARDTDDLWDEYITEVLNDGRAEGKMNVRTRSGEERLFEYRNTLRVRGGEMVIRGVARDVTASVLVYRRLRASEDRFRVLFEANLAGVAITSSSTGRVVDINDAGLRMLGCASREQCLAMDAADFYADPKERDQVMAQLRDAGSATAEIRVRRCDGSVISVMLTGSLIDCDENGDFLTLSTIVDISDRKAIEEEMRVKLRESERDYRALFDHAYDPIIVLDPEDEHVLDANNAACSTLGVTRDDLLTRSMREFSVTAPSADPRVDVVLGAGGKFVEFQTLQRRVDGTMMEIDVSAAAIRYAGHPAILSINRDVTEKRRIESERQRAHSLLRTTLETTADGILVIDRNRQALIWNARYLELWRFDPERAIPDELPDDIEDRVHEQIADPDAYDALVKKRASAPLLVSSDLVSMRDGRILERVARPLIIDSNYAGQVISFRDVTERELRAQHERDDRATLSRIAREWTMTFDAVPHPIVVLDSSLVIRRANRVFGTLAGVPVEELIGRTFESLGNGDPWFTLGVLCSADESLSLQISVGTPRRVWDLSMTIGSDAERPDGWRVVILRDVTAMYELQESLRRSETMSAIGSLIAGVSHQIRNPLFCISSTLDAFEARVGKDDQYQQLIAGLREDAERLRLLTNDLLEYGHPRELSLVPASLAAIIRLAVQSCAKMTAAAGVSIVVDANCDTVFSVDPGWMRQALENLIENAVQHSPARSTITVTLRDDLRFGRRIAILAVEDEGPGFVTADLPRVFEPFYTRRTRGTGLGLSIVQKIVEQHGGTVSAMNGQRGARVEIVL